MLRSTVSRTVSLGVIVCVSPSHATTQTPQSAVAQHQVDAWRVSAHVKVRAILPGAPDSTGPIGTALLNLIYAEPTSRVEFTRNPSAGPWESTEFIPAGMVFLVTPADTASAVTVLDSIQKVFTKPDVRNGFFPMLNPSQHKSPDDPVTHVKDITVTVDRIGAGPVISGHPTVHYRETQHATVQTDAGPMMTIIMKTASTIDFDIATDVADAPSIEAMELEQMVERPLGYMVTPELMAAVHAAQRQYPRGVILHMEDRQTAGSPMGPMTRLAVIDVDRWERSKVDTALLTVPAGYTAAPGFGRWMP